MLKLPNGDYIKAATICSVRVTGEAVPATIDGSMRCWWVQIAHDDMMSVVRFDVKEDADLFASELAGIISASAREECEHLARALIGRSRRERHLDRVAAILAGLMPIDPPYDGEIGGLVEVANKAAIVIGNLDLPA